MASTSLNSLLKRYYNIQPTGTTSELDVINSSRICFPREDYTDDELAEVDRWLTTSSQFSSSSDGQTKTAEELEALNTHLASRTTLLGHKPSVADVAVYDSLAPLVKSWSADQRTGENGHHHIVRYVDFVQNAPLFGLKISDEDKVAMDPDKVIVVPKPLDPKEEKERKRKEKEAAAAAEGKPVVTGQTKKEKVKEAVASAKDAVKETVTGGAAAATGKKEKKEKAPKPQKQPPKETPLSPALIDLRVGHILKAVAHPNADSLYVSTIAVGDPAGTDNTSEYEGQIVRTVCSGLNGLVPLEEMQNRKIVAVCNLKPVTMRGIKSAAMVLAASPRLKEGEVDNHGGPVELVSPPAGARAGERILFDGWEGEPEGVLNPKKKVWEMCQVGFTTTDDLGVAFEVGKVEQLKGEAAEGKTALGKLRVKGGGECTVKSLKGATVR
ncbi:G4 quadruplex nucleic acid binding protein [Thelotrema lepadinum]|nr:G4 quadruplex nucleic acid binding protein [Thelotrema lepadinum]